MIPILLIHHYERYRTYLDGQLCWNDGKPTHASSESQRQCPKCRTKWSYTQAKLEFQIFEKFCNGERSSSAARQIGCSRNTVLSHYRRFVGAMEDLIAKKLLDGGIATNPQTIDEVIQLERALRVGSTKRRASACRHLFLSGLEPDERKQELYAITLGVDITERVMAVQKTIEYLEAMKEYPTHILRNAVGAPPSIELQGLRGVPKPITQFSLVEILRMEAGSFLLRNFPRNPSPQCVELGDPWVRVWKTCRRIILKNYKKKK